MIKAFRYRLYPTRQQTAALEETLELLRQLYNGALQERRDGFRTLGRQISRYDQQKELKEVRLICPEYQSLHVHILQDVFVRVEKAYNGFFRRVKAGEKAGFPRFKGKDRTRSFTFSDAIRRNGARLVAGDKRLYIHGIGKVKIKLHRPMEGRLKQIRIIKDGDGKWYADFICDDVPPKPLPKTGKSVGIDLGIKTFAALSDGTEVQNPRLREAAQPRIARASRKVSRRKRGSNRRKKAVALLAKQHAAVRRQRKHFHHETAKAIVSKYDAVAVEDLNVKGLARGFLSKHVSDVGWSQFVTILSHKAESAGRELHRVEAAGTSQECSRCGEVVRKGLHVRVHRCPHCGLEIDRDLNAAINIEKRLGHSRRGEVGRRRLREPRSRS